MEWISVDSALPSRFADVLLVSIHDDDEVDVFVGRLVNKSEMIFESLSGEILPFVPYWMPLPEPPKMLGGNSECGNTHL